MRKVSYIVAGETFTSYKEAVAFKEQCEAVFGETFDLKTILTETNVLRKEEKNG